MDFTRQGNMTVNSMFPTCFNPGNLLLSFQTNFYRIVSWKPAIFHSAGCGRGGGMEWGGGAVDPFHSYPPQVDSGFEKRGGGGGQTVW